MDQRIINLFDEYTHKPLKREEFMSRLTRLTGSTAAALAVLPLLEVNYAKAWPGVVMVARWLPADFVA